MRGGENCHYVSNSPNPKDSMDVIFTSPTPIEHCYEICSSTGTRDTISTFLVWDSYDVGYSLECHQSHDLFGCVGLRNKQYCIFNKQYDKDTYVVLRQRIIDQLKNSGEWGEFLSPSVSQMLACQQCAKNFKIVPTELAFYRSRKLPIPQLCPGCRHLRRVAIKGPYQLFQRTCAKCGNNIMTNKTEAAAAVVYCDKCYMAEFY